MLGTSSADRPAPAPVRLMPSNAFTAVPRDFRRYRVVLPCISYCATFSDRRHADSGAPRRARSGRYGPFVSERSLGALAMPHEELVALGPRMDRLYARQKTDTLVR